MGNIASNDSPIPNPVERVNRVLKMMISTFVKKDHRSWNVHLHEFRFAVNNTTHSSVGDSPAVLNLSRASCVVSSLRRVVEGEPLLESKDPRAWAQRMRRLPLLHDIVTESPERAHTRQARYYDSHRRDIRYRVGDLVWRRNRVLSSAADNVAAKLAAAFIGPFRVIKVLSPVVYEVETKGTRMIPKVHVSDLKPFVGENPNERTTENNNNPLILAKNESTRKTGTERCRPPPQSGAAVPGSPPRSLSETPSPLHQGP
ncbi:uncharacterized protein LOC128893675 [Hylaeus anthracinus]|uniref:uncharacterized protein LOC128893675 n=1 Tax=Hylaeus anthracinus TaxID=313031 RepID=UPI0023B9801E|nr:uncharacterized protein LOC128893675 [Hylaeus anthracinus]